MKLRVSLLFALVGFSCSSTPGADSGTGGGVPLFTGGGGGGGTGGGTAGGGATGGGTTGGGGVTGGGGATGGGVTGGGATGGGGVTGGGGATGGGAQVPTNGTILRVGMSNQLLAAAPDGSMHMVFAEGAAERIIYGRCTSRCADDASWNFTQLIDHNQIAALTIGVAGFAIDSTGRLHAMVDGVASSGTDPVLYATCAANCGVASSWTSVNIGSLLQNGAVGVINGLTVSATGTIGVVGRGAFGNYQAFYATCSSNCTAGASWTAGAVIDGTISYIGLDGAGVTHALFSAGTAGSGERLHYYARCASGCTQAANWQKSAVGFVHSTSDWLGSLTVTPSGRVFLSFNQGVTTIGSAENNTLFVNTCLGANCTDLANWTSISLGVDDRETDTFLAHDGEAIGLVTATTTEVHFRGCDANCNVAANWSASTTLDTFTAIAQSVPPDTASSCPGTSTSAFWYPGYPRAAATGARIAVAFTSYALVNCPGSPNSQRMPPIGRLFSTF